MSSTKKTMKIYLSGKITGKEKEAHELFEKVEGELLKEDFEVIDPMKLNHNHDKSWESYMKECIKYLVDCDVALLVGNDWNDSRGVELEVYIARSLGIPIVSKEIPPDFVKK